MSRSWKFEEDVFIAQHYCPMLEHAISRFDIKCTVEELRNRVKHLKRKGIWELLREFAQIKHVLELEFMERLDVVDGKYREAHKAALARKKGAA